MLGKNEIAIHPSREEEREEVDPWSFLKGPAKSCGSSRQKASFSQGSLNARERRTKKRKKEVLGINRKSVHQ